MELLILGLLAFAGYKIFRYSVKAGAEATRAYVYLELLNANQPTGVANAYADRVVADPSSPENHELVRRAAFEFRNIHGGKQLPVIGHAYRNGLRPTLPFWHRAIALSAPVTLSVEVAYGELRPDRPGRKGQPLANREAQTGGPLKASHEIHTDGTPPSFATPNWVRKFSIYYLTSNMYLYDGGDNPLPEAIMGLIDRPMDFEINQPFLADLSLYLQKQYGRDRQPRDFETALADARELLTSEIRQANNPATLLNTIQEMYKEDTGTEITKDELTKQYGEFISHIKSSDESARVALGMILKFKFISLFKETHDTDIDKFITHLYHE